MKIDPARVRHLRERRAWSQEQLAEVAGINVRTVQRVEAGGSTSLETRMALAAALEVAPADLLTAPTIDASGPSASLPTREASPTEPPSEQRQHQERVFRKSVLALLGVLIMVLIVGLGYQLGKDLARKQNRADCEAAGRMDCR